MTCADHGPEIVALALGQLPAAEAAALRAHLAGCAPCRAELAEAERLVGATRAAPAPEPSAGAEERLLAAFRAERAATPAPATGAPEVPLPQTKPRRLSRVITLLVPLAAAAVVLVALALGPAEVTTAHVLEGEGTVVSPRTWFGEVPTRPVNGRTEPFEFAPGKELLAGPGNLTVRIQLDDAGAKPTPGRPTPGLVELTLASGTHLKCLSRTDLLLEKGRVDVNAGPLPEGFTLHAPPGYAKVHGTRFWLLTSENRLVASVAEGSVELGRDGGPSEMLEAGEQGLVDSSRLLKRATDGRRGGDGFLTPRASLRAENGPDASKVRLAARLEVGEGGAVAIPAFDDSEPRFLIRLKGDDGRDREVKLLRSMLEEAPPAAAGRSWRLDEGRPYELRISPRALGVPPGRYEARLRYMSYRAGPEGAEWIGVTESDPVPIEVPAQ